MSQVESTLMRRNPQTFGERARRKKKTWKTKA